MEMSNVDNADYKQVDEITHVLERSSMYGAANAIESHETRVIECSTIATRTVKYNELLMKLVDEIISNSVDIHYKARDQCTILDVKYTNTGRIIVYNNGPTVPIRKDPGTGKWLITLCFATMRAGSNFHEERQGRGQNGLGCKLVNIFSNKMVVKCRTGTHQAILTCKNNMRDVGECSITEHVTAGPETVVLFDPDYVKLHYKLPLEQSDHEAISYMIRQRCIQVALSTDLAVRFNGEVLKLHFRDLVSDPVVLSIPGMCELYIQNSTAHVSYTFVNSGLVDDGTHIDWITKAVLDRHGADIAALQDISKCNKNHIRNHLGITGWVEVKNPVYESQTKAVLKSPTVSQYDTIQAAIVDKIRDLVVAGIMRKRSSSAKIQGTRKVKCAVKDLIDAKYAGSKRSKSCTLFISEGLSAQGFVHKGISNCKGKYSGYDYCGAYALGGKIMNVRKQTNIREVGDVQIMDESDALRDSIKINDLIKVIGLNKNCSYDAATPEGLKELDMLRYGKIIIAADQDTDGEHIVGIFINMIGTFWPKLLMTKFIFRLNTPVINVFHGKRSIGFESDAEYQEWHTRQQAHNLLDQYSKPKYHKGLGSWSDKAIFAIFDKISKHMVQFDVQQQCHEELEVYFGKDSSGRKTKLLLPVEHYEYKVGSEFRAMTVKQFLNREVKTYYHDSILRGLSHAIDGLRPTARMLLHGARNMPTKYRKVLEFSQSIGGKYHYIHGDASINAVTCGMAAEYPGSNYFPLLLGEGQFGNTAQGFKACASPRYISICYNKTYANAMYPPVDDVLLPYRVEEGDICEPLYYVPVLPTSVLESYMSVAAAWNTSIQARDVDAVADYVRDLIAGKPPQQELLYSSYTYGQTNGVHICDVYESGEKILFVGKAKLLPREKTEKARIHITALPPGVWHTPLTAKWSAMNNVQQVVNRSKDGHSSNEINIEVYLTNTVDLDNTEVTEGELECGITQLVKYLGLYKCVRNRLNYFTGDISDRVCTGFQSYKEVIAMWFDKRKEMYALRVERRVKILNWRISLLRNSMCYILDHEKFRIGKNTKVGEVIAALQTDKYDMLNKAHINNPQNVPTDQIDKYMVEDASYDYLLKMTDMDKLQEGYDKLERQLCEINKELASYRDKKEAFTGASLWLAEIDAVMNIIHAARQRGGWYIDENEY